MFQSVIKRFSPLDLPFLTLWYDASFVIDNNGGSPPPNGGSAYSFFDLSGSGFDSYCPSVSPLYYLNTINSRPIVKFGNPGSAMFFPEISLDINSAVFIVYQVTSTNVTLLQSSSQTTYIDRNAGTLRVFDGTDTFTSSALSVPYSNYSLIEIIRTYPNIYFFENGNPKGSASDLGTLFIYLDEISGFSGAIAEIIIYNNNEIFGFNYLNTERQNVERYLNQKYNLWNQD